MVPLMAERGWFPGLTQVFGGEITRLYRNIWVLLLSVKPRKRVKGAAKQFVIASADAGGEFA